MLKGRNQPEGAGEAAPEAADGVLLVEAVAPAAHTAYHEAGVHCFWTAQHGMAYCSTANPMQHTSISAR